MTQIKKSDLLKMYNDLNEDTLRQLGVYDEAREVYEEKKILEERKSRDIEEAKNLVKDAEEILKKHDLELRITKRGVTVVNKNRGQQTYPRNTSQEISQTNIQNLRTRNEVFQYTDKIEIILNNLHTPKKHGLIPLTKKNRSFFPGFKIPFILDTDIGEIITKVTSAPKGTEIGDPEKGNYIQGGLKPWYDKHRELKEGVKLIIELIEPEKRYRLSISKSL